MATPTIAIMFSSNAELTPVYLKVEELFKIKIKRYLLGSELIFTQLTESKDLLSEKEFYTLVINEKVFEFRDVKELCRGLLKVIEVELKELSSEIEYYEEHKREDIGGGLPMIYETLEMLYNRDYKLDKLRLHIDKLLNK